MKSYRKSNSRIRYTALSELSGVRGGGYNENAATSLKNLKPTFGSLRVRNGIERGATLDGGISYAESVNNNGRISAFIVSGSCVYEVSESSGNAEIGEARFISESPLDPERIFFFSAGGETFFFDGERFYRYESSEFLPFDGGLPTADIGRPALPLIPANATKNGRSLLTGRVSVKMTLPCDTSSIVIEEAPLHVDSVIAEGERVEAQSLVGSVLALPEPRQKGDNLIITLSYEPESLPSLALRGASDESEGEAYIYSPTALYRFSLSDSMPVMQRVLSLPEGGLKRAFFSEGSLLLAIGSGISVFDPESGKARLVDCDGVWDKSSICPCGGFAFLATGEEIVRLTVKGSGSGENIDVVSMKDSFSDREKRRFTSMAYSRADRTLYTVSERYGERALHALDTESGIWYEIEGSFSPVSVFECSDSVVISDGETLFFTSPEMSADRYGEEYSSIKGEITLSESFLGEVDRMKRLRSVSPALSGLIDAFSLVLRGDNGLSDSYSVRYSTPVKRNIFESIRMNIGCFKSLTLTAIIEGRDNASLKDIYLAV